MSDLDAFADRYIAVWNETDARLRRRGIEELFAPDVAHYTPTLEVHGHDELEKRIIGSHMRWVEPGEHFFRAVPNADGHHNSVRFNWEMVHRASGETVSVGFDFILLDSDGLIRSDHQFVDR